MSKNQSNEFQHVLPALPGLVATVVYADWFRASEGPKACADEYRVVGWGVTACNAVPILAGFDRDRMDDLAQGLMLILVPHPSRTGFVDTWGITWKSIESASEAIVRAARRTAEAAKAAA